MKILLIILGIIFTLYLAICFYIQYINRLMKEAAEDTIPEMYFLKLLTEIRDELRNEIFNKLVLVSLAKGYDKNKINSDFFKNGDKVDKKKVKFHFYNSLFLHCMFVFRNYEKGLEVSEVEKCVKRIENKIDKDIVIDLLQKDELKKTIKEMCKDVCVK